MFYDWTIIFLVPAVVVTVYAQWKVHSVFKKASSKNSSSNLKGSEVAALILKREGILDVKIEKANGFLGDHYNPIKKTLNLSPETFDKNTIAALGVAAHEAGHAVQHSKKYKFLVMRQGLYSVSKFSSTLAPILFIIGLMVSYTPLLNIGIGFFALSVLFTIITLPVEFNASKRAIILLNNTGIVSASETEEVKKVLNAAALTYVAAALMAILELIRLLIIARHR